MYPPLLALMWAHDMAMMLFKLFSRNELLVFAPKIFSFQISCISLKALITDILLFKQIYTK